MSYFDKESLLNRKILSVSKDIAGETFEIQFEDGVVRFSVEGDCCSRSWIEHFEVPNDLSGSILLSVTENLMSSTNDENDNNLKVYETRFRTNKGDIVLEYRNSSNGYYGGYLEVID